MAQGKRKEIYKYKCFIDAVKFNTIKDLEADKTLSRNAIIKKYSLSGEIANRFKWSRKDNDTPDRVILTHFNLNATTYKKDEWVEIPTHYVEIAKQIIEANYKAKTNDILNKIIIKLEGKEEREIMENIKNVMIDAGNFEIKVMSGEKFINFSSKTFVGEMRNENKFEWIKYAGQKTFFETSNGNYNHSYEKVDKTNISQIIYAIDKLLNPTDEIYTVNLGYMLPISQLERGNELVERFEGQEFEYDTKEGTKIVKINRLIVIPEGFATANYILATEPLKMKGRVIFFDCGSRTINACEFTNGKLTNNDTMIYGTFGNLYEPIQKKYPSKSIEVIAEDLKNEWIDIPKEIGKTFTQGLLNEFTSFQKLWKEYHTVFVSGGVADFFNTYEYMYEMLPDNVEVLNDAGKTNVIGAYKILEEEINSMMEMV